jgi:hypothetical protein
MEKVGLFIEKSQFLASSGLDLRASAQSVSESQLVDCRFSGPWKSFLGFSFDTENPFNVLDATWDFTVDTEPCPTSGTFVFTRSSGFNHITVVPSRPLTLAADISVSLHFFESVPFDLSRNEGSRIFRESGSLDEARYSHRRRRKNWRVRSSAQIRRPPKMRTGIA